MFEFMFGKKPTQEELTNPFSTAPVEPPLTNQQIAVKRIRKLIETIKDLNPTITDIKYIEYEYHSGYSYDTSYRSYYYSIETKAGLRFLKIEKNRLAFGDGYNCQPYTPIIGGPKCDYKFNRLYEVYVTEKYNLNVVPELTVKSPMNEEQIYNSIKEIEDIIYKHEYPTKSEEHKANLTKFVDRFTELT